MAKVGDSNADLSPSPFNLGTLWVLYHRHSLSIPYIVPFMLHAVFALLTCHLWTCSTFLIRVYLTHHELTFLASNILSLEATLALYCLLPSWSSSCSVWY